MITAKRLLFLATISYALTLPLQAVQDNQQPVRTTITTALGTNQITVTNINQNLQQLNQPVIPSQVHQEEYYIPTNQQPQTSNGSELDLQQLCLKLRDPGHALLTTGATLFILGIAFYKDPGASITLVLLGDVFMLLGFAAHSLNTLASPEN